jgi:hypothetical protein
MMAVYYRLVKDEINCNKIHCGKCRRHTLAKDSWDMYYEHCYEFGRLEAKKEYYMSGGTRVWRFVPKRHHKCIKHFGIKENKLKNNKQKQ